MLTQKKIVTQEFLLARVRHHVFCDSGLYISPIFKKSHQPKNDIYNLRMKTCCNKCDCCKNCTCAGTCNDGCSCSCGCCNGNEGSCNCNWIGYYFSDIIFQLTKIKFKLFVGFLTNNWVESQWQAGQTVNYLSFAGRVPTSFWSSDCNFYNLNNKQCWFHAFTS